MKNAKFRLPQPQPRPAVFLLLFLGLISTITAALAPFEVFGPKAGAPEETLLTFDRVLEVAPGDDLLTVSFTLPATAEWTAPDPVSPPQFFPADPVVVLRAIAAVESNGDPTLVGRMGERGLYQFRRTTWRQHTEEDFRRAHHPEISATVARRHYDWICEALRARGYQATPYEVALAWNAGLSRVLSGRAPSRSHHYAQRVANLARSS
jgi:hypothetical protein